MWKNNGDRLFHWRKLYVLWTGILAWTDSLKLQHPEGFVSQDINWWTGGMWITSGLLWCFYQLYGLPLQRHPLTAEDPLGEQLMQCLIYQNLFWWRNKLIYIQMASGWIHFQQFFIFGWPLPLRYLMNEYFHAFNVHRRVGSEGDKEKKNAPEVSK